MADFSQEFEKFGSFYCFIIFLFILFIMLIYLFIFFYKFSINWLKLKFQSWLYISKRCDNLKSFSPQNQFKNCKAS